MTTKFLTGGAVAALAAALAFTAVPASARDRHDRDSTTAQASHGHWFHPRANVNRGQTTQHTVSPQAHSDRGHWYHPDANRHVQAAPRTTTRRPGWGDGPRATVTERNRTYVDPGRNRTYVDPNRNRSYGDNRQAHSRDWRSDRRDNDHRWRNDRRDNDRDWRADRRGNYQRWNRHWRNNNRYDWQRYRAYNRNIYRLNPYYAPYRGYSYRRLGIGVYLDPLFYGQDYWISDPWYYRLPDVYGPYRWVRYYDDALLVNVYTGEVVDVIHDFFW